MPDMFSPEKRSEIMASVRSKNGRAERTVFAHLRKQGIYFQKHYRHAPGTPDIAQPKKKRACFIDGDFWHGRSVQNLLAKRGAEDFWTKKIMTNMSRDKMKRQKLSEEGWSYISVWESDINRLRTRAETLSKIEDFLS